MNRLVKLFLKVLIVLVVIVLMGKWAMLGLDWLALGEPGNRPPWGANVRVDVLTNDLPPELLSEQVHITHLALLCDFVSYADGPWYWDLLIFILDLFQSPVWCGKNYSQETLNTPILLKPSSAVTVWLKAKPLSWDLPNGRILTVSYELSPTLRGSVGVYPTFISSHHWEVDLGAALRKEIAEEGQLNLHSLNEELRRR